MPVIDCSGIDTYHQDHITLSCYNDYGATLLLHIKQCRTEASSDITVQNVMAYPKGTIEDGGAAIRLCCFAASSLNIIFSSFFAHRASLCNSEWRQGQTSQQPMRFESMLCLPTPTTIEVSLGVHGCRKSPEGPMTV